MNIITSVLRRVSSTINFCLHMMGEEDIEKVALDAWRTRVLLNEFSRWMAEFPILHEVLEDLRDYIQDSRIAPGDIDYQQYRRKLREKYKSEWNPLGVPPKNRGIYAIRWKDDHLLGLAAYADGIWYFPAASGWVPVGQDDRFSWAGPVAGITWKTPEEGVPTQ